MIKDISYNFYRKLLEINKYYEIEIVVVIWFAYIHSPF